MDPGRYLLRSPPRTRRQNYEKSEALLPNDKAGLCLCVCLKQWICLKVEEEEEEEEG